MKLTIVLRNGAFNHFYVSRVVSLRLTAASARLVAGGTQHAVNPGGFLTFVLKHDEPFPGARLGTPET
jgi:hypothetical protein